MNKKSKLLALILCAVCILTACVCLCACDDEPTAEEPPITEPPTYFQIDVNAQEGGSCQLSNPADENGYVKDESVTVTVVENEGYSLSEMTVNGQKVEPTDNAYTFTLTQNTEIAVGFVYCAVFENDDEKGTITLSMPKNGHYFESGESVSFKVKANAHFSIVDAFADNEILYSKNGTYTFKAGDNRPVIAVTYVGAPIPQSTFDSLCGSVKFSGDYVYNLSNGESAHNTIETIFNANAVRQVEKDFETGEVFYDTYILRNSEDNRTIAYLTRTINNEVVEVPQPQYNFSEFSNQFNLLSADDFEYISEGVYSLMDSNKAKRVASVITGWNESIAKFYIYVENDLAVRAEIVTEAIYADEDLTYVSTYNFEISDHGTATIPPIEPFERDENHDALEQALQTAQLATQYTINHFGHEVGYVPPEDGKPDDGYGDLDYYVYVTEDMIYDSFPTEEYGYKVLNGYVYPFTYESSVNKVVITDPINVASIQELQASFEGFSAEMFEFVGDGKYVLRDNSLASAIATLFGEGTNEKAYYSYAVNLTITIKDGVLYTIEFTTETYGLNEEVRLTYDFDSPIDVGLDFDNVTKESVLDPFKGTYASDNGDYIVVDSYGFTINGIEASIVSYNKNEDGVGIFKLKWKDNMVLYAQKLSTKQIIIASEDSTLIITATMLGDQIVSIPADMKGTWFGSATDGQVTVEHTVIIQSYVVKLDGKILNVLSYTDAEGLTCEDENTTYTMWLTKDDADKTLLTLVKIFEDTTWEALYLDRVSTDVGIEIPLEFVGTYLEMNSVGLIPKRIVVTTSAITVNGVEFIPTSYDNDSKIFRGALGDDTNAMIDFSRADRAICHNITYERTEVILPTYIGTWQSNYDPNDPSDTQYIVIIDETSININGTYVEFVKDEYGYTFEMPGSAYTTHIIYSSTSNGKVTLWMYDNNILLKSLTKVGASGDTKWPTTHIGTWTGTSSGTEYTITITEDSLSFKVGDAEAVVCSKAEYDMDAIVFTYEGHTYVFGLQDGSAYAYCQEIDWYVIFKKTA